MSNPEVQRGGNERSAEVAGEAAGEQLKKLHEQLEKTSENKESQSERIRSAEKSVESIMSKEAGKEKKGSEPASQPTPHATKKQRKSSYKKTMDQVQSELSAPSRAFSKVIHNPAVEKTSDAIGGTIARPNALLAGAITATFLSLAVYLVARYYGYPLSQSESIIAFALGWALGIIYDYSRLMVRGRRG